MVLPWVEALRRSPDKKLQGLWVVGGVTVPETVTIELEFLSFDDFENPEAKLPYVTISPVYIPEFARPIFNRASEIHQEVKFWEKKYCRASPTYGRSGDSIRWNPKNFPETRAKLQGGISASSANLIWEIRYKNEDLEVGFLSDLVKIEWLKLGRQLLGQLVRRQLEFWSGGITYIIPMYIALCVVLDQGIDPLQSVSGTTDFVFFGLDYVD